MYVASRIMNELRGAAKCPQCGHVMLVIEGNVGLTGGPGLPPMPPMPPAAPPALSPPLIPPSEGEAKKGNGVSPKYSTEKK